jgi:hypothetical protein
MKKLSILLIGLLLLTGFAFANDEFEGVPVTDIDISATATWGVDLNTNYTGFTNVATFNADLWWVNAGDEIDFVSAAMDDMYGWIKVNDVNVSISGGSTAAATTITFASIEAKIVISPAEIRIWAGPKTAWGNVAMIDAADAGIAPTLASDELVAATIGGLSIILPVAPATIKVYVLSDGSWLTNTDNDYAAGVDLTVAVAPITVDVGGFYGWFDAAATWGGTAKAKVALADVLNGLDITVAADFQDGTPLPWEVGFGTVVKFTPANPDDDDSQANLAINVVYSEASDLDLSVVFTEPKALAFVDKMAATVTLKVLNLLGTIGWTVDVTGEYTIQDGLTPSFGFGYGSDEIADLMVKLVLGAAFTGIDLTTITLLYDADDLTDMDVALVNDIGIFTIAAAVAFP